VTIPFKTTVCGIEELPDHSAVGVTHVLSILDPGWPVPDAFGSFGEHQRLELRFNDVIEDFADASTAAARTRCSIARVRPEHFGRTGRRRTFAGSLPRWCVTLNGVHYLDDCSGTASGSFFVDRPGHPSHPATSVAQPAHNRVRGCGATLRRRACSCRDTGLPRAAVPTTRTCEADDRRRPRAGSNPGAKIGALTGRNES
jgi:hypothetical protein